MSAILVLVVAVSMAVTISRADNFTYTTALDPTIDFMTNVLRNNPAIIKMFDPFKLPTTFDVKVMKVQNISVSGISSIHSTEGCQLAFGNQQVMATLKLATGQVTMGIGYDLNVVIYDLHENIKAVIDSIGMEVTLLIPTSKKGSLQITNLSVTQLKNFRATEGNPLIKAIIGNQFAIDALRTAISVSGKMIINQQLKNMKLPWQTGKGLFPNAGKMTDMGFVVA